MPSPGCRLLAERSFRISGPWALRVSCSCLRKSCQLRSFRSLASQAKKAQQHTVLELLEVAVIPFGWVWYYMGLQHAASEATSKGPLPCIDSVLSSEQSHFNQCDPRRRQLAARSLHQLLLAASIAHYSFLITLCGSGFKAESKRTMRGL